MGNVPQLIFCYGKNPSFAPIAINAGYRYGAQLPCTTYAKVYFADQDWSKPNRAAYIQALSEHRPVMATVLDLERETQLPEVLSWAEEAACYCERILIIPKYSGAIDSLPRQIGRASVVLAFSIPTRYGGTEVPIWEFAGWPVHLLGGSPQAQMHYAAHLNAIADVVSVDGNMHCLQAQSCRFWSKEKGPKGHWIQLSEMGDTDRSPGANLRAFRRSCQNIIEAWNNE